MWKRMLEIIMIQGEDTSKEKLFKDGHLNKEINYRTLPK